MDPDSINTGIGQRRTHYLRDGSPYSREYRTMIEHLDANERAGTTPEKVAATILAAMRAEHPRPLYAVGSRAPLVPDDGLQSELRDGSDVEAGSVRGDEALWLQLPSPVVITPSALVH